MGFGLPLALITPHISFDEIPNQNAAPIVSEYQAESLRAPLYELVSIEENEGISSAAEATATAVRLNPPEAPRNAIELLVQTELDATYNTRQCFIDSESRVSGMYTAEYGGSPGGADGGTASGAYQWLDPFWPLYVAWTEEFYGFRLTSPEEEAGRYHAAFAPPFVQDLVTTFAILHPERAQDIIPWTHTVCYWMVGTEKRVRPDGPEFAPTPFIQAQIDAMN